MQVCLQRALRLVASLFTPARLRDPDAQECIYEHFLQSKEAKRVLNGKQSKVLPAINGAQPAYSSPVARLRCCPNFSTCLMQRSRSCAIIRS